LFSQHRARSGAKSGQEKAGGEVVGGVAREVVGDDYRSSMLGEKLVKRIRSRRRWRVDREPSIGEAIEPETSRSGE
jgi:hypothetical protein